MTRIAFYAPMKSPRHAVPSGDREMARGIVAALADPIRNVDVDLASEFRSYDGKGDPALQEKLVRDAEQEAERLAKTGQWSAWVTYHSYYKAPDLLGPAVSKALGIPYILVEATRAAKRLGGPWDRFARLADASCEAASAIFYLTEQDREGLWPYRKDGQPLIRLQPFLQAEDLPEATDRRKGSLFVAGMMRAGDKLASYKIIAETLGKLQSDWTCEIAGDGPALPEVQALMAPYGDRVRFLGQLSAEEMHATYQGARVFLWPGVNEAFGMVYLEAQAAGVPVVAQNRPGVCDVLPVDALSAVGDVARLANSVDKLLTNPSYWAERSAQARALVRDRHLLGGARATLWSALDPLMEG